MLQALQALLVQGEEEVAAVAMGQITVALAVTA
jgi:hypothetical protein